MNARTDSFPMLCTALPLRSAPWPCFRRAATAADNSPAIRITAPNRDVLPAGQPIRCCLKSQAPTAAQVVKRALRSS